MSIASELSRLQQAKSDLATSIANKGVTVPTSATLDEYAALVDSIQQGGLPYGARIEYIEGTGTQWIDTGVYVSATDYAYIDMEFSFTEINTSDNNILAGNYALVSRVSRRNFLFVGSDKKWKIGYGSGSVQASNTIASVDTNYVVSAVLRDYNQSITVNNQLVLNKTDHNTNISNLPFAIFGAYYNGNIMSPSKMRLKSFKLTLDSADADARFDAVPVRLGTTGYLYDKVSGQLFGNSGTGSFILGADKN